MLKSRKSWYELLNWDATVPEERANLDSQCSPEKLWLKGNNIHEK